MQVAFYFAGEITQVLDAIPWVRCASGNVSFCFVNSGEDEPEESIIHAIGEASLHQKHRFLNIVQKGGGVKPLFKMFVTNFV